MRPPPPPPSPAPPTPIRSQARHSIASRPPELPRQFALELDPDRSLTRLRARPRPRVRRPRSLSVALRRWFAKHRRWYWPLVVTLTVVTTASVQRRAAAFDAARSAWDTKVDVWVATRDLGIGEPVASNVRRVQVPKAAAPPSALRRPSGTIRQNVDAGAPLTRADVSPRTDELALVPDGWAVVAVIEQVGSGTVTGDRVDATSDGATIASGALVVGTVGEATLIAVRPENAAALAAASTAGHLSLVRYPQR